MNSKIKDHFRKNDPTLYAVTGKIKPLVELSLSKDYISDLCGAIINQQLSEKASATIFSRFKKLFPKGKITAKYLLSVSDEKIRSVGSSWGKVSYLKNLARKVFEKELQLDQLDELDNGAVIKKLTTVKGIGPWTAEMFLMFSLGREDIFSYGDLGLQKAIQKLYKLKAKPTKGQMEKLAKRWIPYRTYAARILWRSLEIE